MPIYHITIGFRGYEVVEVEADSPEDAQERYNEGYGEYFDEERVETHVVVIECQTDENDIEHHIQRS